MRRKLMIPAMVILLSAPSVILAQRGGQGHGGQGRGGQQGQGSPPATQQRGGSQQGSQTGQQTGSRDQQEKRIHTTDQQRDQHKTCTDSADRLRRQSGEISQLTQGSNFDLSQAREQRDRLHDETRILTKEHDRFMKNLSAEQRSVMGEEIQKMDKSRDRLEERLQAMDQQLDQANPDRNRINERARELEEAVEAFQRQHREMGSQMGVEPSLNP